ncbi:MAG: helix-turn-helix transcriptional regulator [Coriobacteriales bacterium]|nr:helix-turn-helix transcriptional regulator [Coriobacteriales bacterium]
MTDTPVSLTAFGRRLKAARAIAGYDRMTDLASAIEAACGTSISARSLYAIERGEQMPSYEQLVCIIVVMPIESQQDLFRAAIRPDLQSRLWLSE